MLPSKNAYECSFNVSILNNYFASHQIPPPSSIDSTARDSSLIARLKHIKIQVLDDGEKKSVTSINVKIASLGKFLHLSSITVIWLAFLDKIKWNNTNDRLEKSIDFEICSSMIDELLTLTEIDRVVENKKEILLYLSKRNHEKVFQDLSLAIAKQSKSDLDIFKVFFRLQYEDENPHEDEIKEFIENSMVEVSEKIKQQFDAAKDKCSKNSLEKNDPSIQSATRQLLECAFAFWISEEEQEVDVLINYIAESLISSFEDVKSQIDYHPWNWINEVGEAISSLQSPKEKEKEFFERLAKQFWEILRQENKSIPITLSTEPKKENPSTLREWIAFYNQK